MAQLLCDRCGQPTALGHSCKPYIGISNVPFYTVVDNDKSLDPEIADLVDRNFKNLVLDSSKDDELKNKKMSDPYQMPSLEVSRYENMQDETKALSDANKTGYLNSELKVLLEREAVTIETDDGEFLAIDIDATYDLIADFIKQYGIRERIDEVNQAIANEHYEHGPYGCTPYAYNSNRIEELTAFKDKQGTK